MQQPPLRTLLFDLDNTLVDFSGAEKKAFADLHQHFLKQQHTDIEKNYLCYQAINAPLWQDVEKGIITPRQAADMRIQKLLRQLKITHPAEEVVAHYENCLAKYTDWLPGVTESLDKLQQQFQLGVITNGLKTVQSAKYNSMHLGEWFDCYVISDEVKLAKPDPEIFSIALQQLGAQAEQTLMVGDSLSSDYRGAINSDIDFCWVHPQAESPVPDAWPEPRFKVKSVTELEALLIPHESYREIQA